MKLKSYLFKSAQEVADFHKELSSLSKADWFKLGELTHNNVSYSFYVYDLNGNAIMFAGHYY